MTRFLSLIFLLSLTVATFKPPHVSAQATSPSAGPQKDDDDKKPAPRRKDKDDDDDDDRKPARGGSASAPVITVKGLCAKPKRGSSANCQTTISRAQFETLVDAVAPGMSPQTRKQLATSYPKLLVMARDAEAKGLDRGLRFDELMRFARQQVLAQELVRQIKDESNKVSDKDVEDYYAKHPDVFQVAVVDRIFVPIRKEGTATPTGGSDDSDLSQLADQLHSRAVAGEDFAKLQNEAYKAAGANVSTTISAQQNLKRAEVPASHVSIFDLKAGEISPVIADASGHYIYKMERMEVQPLAVAKAGIVTKLQSQRLHDAMDAIEKSFSVDIDNAYFAAASAKDDDD